MRGPAKYAPAAVTTFLCGALLWGCGGGGAETTASSTARAGVVSPRSASFQKYSGEKATELQLAEFGTEGSREDRLRVQAVVNSYLEATENDEWSKACSYASVVLRSQIEEIIRNAKRPAGLTCAKVLRALAKSPSEGQVAPVVRPPVTVASLRVKEGPGGGFALFHGNDGKDYWVAVRRDSPGQWRVLSIAAQAFSE